MFWWTEHPLKAPPKPSDEESQHTHRAGPGPNGLIHHNDAMGQQDFEFKPTHDQEGQGEKEEEEKRDEAEGRDDGNGRKQSRSLSSSRRRSSFGRKNSFARRKSIGARLGRVLSDSEHRDEIDPEGLTREATEELDGHFILEQALHIPKHLEVSYEEMAVLRGLRERMLRGGEVIIEDGEPHEIGRTTSRG